MITVNYLGQVYGCKSPSTRVTDGAGHLRDRGGRGVLGWDKTLVGQKVGSRVVVAIPPKDGYGSKGQPTAGIKGTDTLYFVVDILGAA